VYAQFIVYLDRLAITLIGRSAAARAIYATLENRYATYSREINLSRRLETFNEHWFLDGIVPARLRRRPDDRRAGVDAAKGFGQFTSGAECRQSNCQTMYTVKSRTHGAQFAGYRVIPETSRRQRNPIWRTALDTERSANVCGSWNAEP